MKPIPGPRPAELREVARVEDRLTFVYLERCKVHRADNAITATDAEGTVYFPSALVGALLLGPGTEITHQAMWVLADSGTTVVWVGEQGVRYYGHGRPMAASSALVLKQAAAVSNRITRLAVARRMYEMRFDDDDDVSSLTMQQLRGREGARVRRRYRQVAQQFGISWEGRDYSPDDFEASDAVNQALSSATSCLYGIVHAVIVALGCSPALGFIHTGNDRSFVYDIADLYKMDFAVPVAFEVASRGETDPGAATRLAMRDLFRSSKLLTRIVYDVKGLLSGSDDDDQAGQVELWDGRDGTVDAGRAWLPDTDDRDLPW